MVLFGKVITSYSLNILSTKIPQTSSLLSCVCIFLPTCVCVYKLVSLCILLCVSAGCGICGPIYVKHVLAIQASLVFLCNIFFSPFGVWFLPGWCSGATPNVFGGDSWQQ